MTKAFLMINATRVDVSEPRLVAGALQQELRLYDGDVCGCVVLATYPAGSAEWEKFHAARRLDEQQQPSIDPAQAVAAGDVADPRPDHHPV